MMNLWDFLAISGAVAWIWNAVAVWRWLRDFRRRLIWAISGWRQPRRRTLP